MNAITGFSVQSGHTLWVDAASFAVPRQQCPVPVFYLVSGFFRNHATSFDLGSIPNIMEVRSCASHADFSRQAAE